MESAPRLEVLRVLTEALSAMKLCYDYSISPNPSVEDGYRIVFSRPTNASPEPTLSIYLDLELKGESDGQYHFTGLMEGTQWPIMLDVTPENAAGLAESYIDSMWRQKQHVYGLV